MNKYLNMLNQKGLIYVINRFHVYFPLKLITCVAIMKANNEWRLYHKYKKKYRYIIKKNSLSESQIRQGRSSKDFKIWTLWLQGEEKAPLLVKKCFSQMRKFYGEGRLVVLDEISINHYVDLPEHITDKYNRGLISRAHYSDIVRTILLCDYGGVWIDSTCLLTSELPAEIFNSRFFVFRLPLCFPGAIKASNWFILSEKNSAIMQLVKAMLIEYWEKHNYIEDYSLYHIFFSIAVDVIKVNNKEWADMPYYNNDNTHILQRELLNQYNEQRYDNLCKIGCIHKLSWKIKNTSSSTFYSYICNQMK